jgi:hypothetical protein
LAENEGGEAMADVRIVLIDGRIVEGRITNEGRPKLLIDGKPYSVMDAVLKGMSVMPVDDPVFDRWKTSYM